MPQQWTPQQLDAMLAGLTPGQGPQYQQFQGSGTVNQGLSSWLQANPNSPTSFASGFGRTLASLENPFQGTNGQDGELSTGPQYLQGAFGVDPTKKPEDYQYFQWDDSRMDDGLSSVDFYNNQGKHTRTDLYNDPGTISTGFAPGDLSLLAGGLAAMGGLMALPGGAFSTMFGGGGATGSGAGFVGEGAASGIPGWDGALAGAGAGDVGAVGSGAGFLGEGVSSGIPGWDGAVGSGVAGAGSGAGGLGSTISKALGNLGWKDWLKIGSVGLGALAGGQGSQKSVTETKELPEYLRGPVTGPNGLLNSANSLMQHQLYGSPMRGLI
jgi:hypothetical protein